MCPIDFDYLKSIVEEHKEIMYEYRKKVKEEEQKKYGCDKLRSGTTEESNGKSGR